MGEIPDDQVEWATIDRLRQMLPADQAEYKLTQCYALFTGILCWTIQRIRAPLVEGDPISAKLQALRKELEAEAFSDFAVLPDRVLDCSKGEVRFNDLSALFEKSGSEHSLDVLVNLRNSVSHGDSRRIKPINCLNELVGFQFHCCDRGQTWGADVYLDRHGIAQIASVLAQSFCNSLSGGVAEFEGDAKGLKDSA